MSDAPLFHVDATSTLKPVLNAWRIYLKDSGKSKYTVKSFIGDLELFANYFPIEQTIGSISTENINAFLEWLQKDRGIPCSPKSYSRRITSIKSFFRWLSINGRISLNPAEKILQKTVISPLPKILSKQEQAALYEAADAFRNLEKPDSRAYLLFSLLILTGIKKGECLAIHLNHLDLKDPKKPILFVRYTNPSNRFKERNIELSPKWVEVLNEYCDQYRPKELLFSWSPRRLEYILEELGDKASISKHLSFDMCRWTCAANDWVEGKDKDYIRQKLGVSKMQWREINSKLRKLAEFA